MVATDNSIYISDKAKQKVEIYFHPITGEKIKEIIK